MHSEHRFSDLTESLKNGFLVDDIVLALARAEKGQPLGEKERKLLKDAVSLLKSAEAGIVGWKTPKSQAKQSPPPPSLPGL
jgi:RNA polymerase-interacting CarD/CdnL/TRCF family regulator